MLYYFYQEKAKYTGRNRIGSGSGEISNVSNYDLLEKSWYGKRFPGGPSCIFRNNEVPYFCLWNINGGMTTEILTDIL